MGDIGENGEYLPVRALIFTCTSKENHDLTAQKRLKTRSTNFNNNSSKNVSTPINSVSDLRSDLKSNSNSVQSSTHISIPDSVQNSKQNSTQNGTSKCYPQSDSYSTSLSSPNNLISNLTPNTNFNSNSIQNCNLSTQHPRDQNSTSASYQNFNNQRNSRDNFPSNEELDFMLYLELLRRQEQLELQRLERWNEQIPWKPHNKKSKAKTVKK